MLIQQCNGVCTVSCGEEVSNGGLLEVRESLFSNLGAVLQLHQFQELDLGPLIL